MTKRRTTYTLEFKQQAISLVREANRPAATVGHCPTTIDRNQDQANFC